MTTTHRGKVNRILQDAGAAFCIYEPDQYRRGCGKYVASGLETRKAGTAVRVTYRTAGVSGLIDAEGAIAVRSVMNKLIAAGYTITQQFEHIITFGQDGSGDWERINAAAITQASAYGLTAADLRKGIYDYRAYVVYAFDVQEAN